jgi:hypothetical protein
VREIVVVFVMLPETPVMVTVAVPVVAVGLAVSVRVLALVALVGLNEAVRPLGKPETDKLTLPLKPFWGVTAMVLVPLEPCAIVRLFGDAERVNVGGGFTVSETVVVADKFPDEPETVTVTVPVAAVLVAESVSVLAPVVLAGLKAAVTPAGKPEADKLTPPLKPFCGVTVMVLVPLAPCAIVRLLGEAETVKLP